MGKKVLITGGAGFVGSHVADELLEAGYAVRVLDNLAPQVHGTRARRPDYLAREVDFIRGDVRDPEAVSQALEDVDAVFHFAAVVGVGQSMYEIAHYTSTNSQGTAVLLEALAQRPIERLVVASSMSIYGEGLYRAHDGELIEGRERTLEQLRAHDWQVRGRNGEPLIPVPTPESKCPALPSVYAICKFHQERLCMTVGRAYGIATVALRFFNIFGTRQALSNPYTGVLAIFASRFLNNNPPLVNEDGKQRRDFVHVRDVAQACRLALEIPEAADEVFNIGSGHNYSILEIAEQMARVLGKDQIEPAIIGKCRVGDIRNCFADVSRARKILGYKPRVSLEEGLAELADWLGGQIAIDRVDHAARELSLRGLAV
ncbi:MAG TPA: SDR family NAD(P)-dependent oxidoreductase [Candidatus Udaeobacter sp.]|jgi:dTDP-L-rhamnose 4-epimerase|nr:SDR family NAD(P)-dependent oxidoreductase [Candidatus Udaeobacter sp.]